MLTGRLEVPDGNGADVIASQWQWMRKEARDAGRPEFRALVEAAYAQPVLRALCPYTGHWALSFAAAPDVPFDTPVFISPAASCEGGGPCTVRQRWNGPTIMRAGTAAAIAFAVERVPGFFGDVTAPR
ncbi:DUF6193 family natural product biosynthesis protein [Kitasatospora sp. NPDC053057]|uniref:DUF6193 family natural product biosynthesis protein n=1 Tax=Kitasatospora sp. NPDC053057 TaxID=3364062 RepID=UPI0037C65398